MGWKQAVFAFKASKGRYPGDINNIGKFGEGSGYTYVKTEFAPPFDTGSFTPNEAYAPFVELYTEGISDFKPTSNYTYDGYPSKAYSDIYLRYSYNTLTSETTSYFAYRFRINIMNLAIYSKSYNINPKVAKTLDEKIDDGIYNSGNLRFACYKKVDDVEGYLGLSSYDDSINTKSSCVSARYDLRLE